MPGIRDLFQFNNSSKSQKEIFFSIQNRSNMGHRDIGMDTNLTYSKRKLTPNKKSFHDTPHAATQSAQIYYLDEMSDRKSSLESLTSVISYESQVSINSSESQDNSSSKPVPNTRTKRTDHSPSITVNITSSNRSDRRLNSSSTGCSDGKKMISKISIPFFTQCLQWFIGETDIDTPTKVQSAPPVLNTTSTYQRELKYHPNVSLTYSSNSEIWRRRDVNYGDHATLPASQKTPLARTMNVSQYKNLTDNTDRVNIERPHEASNFNLKLETEGRYVRRETASLDSKTTADFTSNENIDHNALAMKEMNYKLLRRQNSEGDASKHSINQNRTVPLPAKEPPHKLSEKSEPDVPVRSARRNRHPREMQCRSMGDSASEANNKESRNIFLGTIKESELNKPICVWTRQDVPVETHTRSVTDWVVNKNESKNQPVGKRTRSNAITTLELRRRNSDPATNISGNYEKFLSWNLSIFKFKLKQL